ncbi:MAG: aminopeptidase P N-terminal domain-containing protein [Cyclobacteriaceae bacterium]|nr:aminopeptidase P N-terminal domain-containing protein [Cyclobacteriaceae bacterium HetDA_MAG_MS6]
MFDIDCILTADLAVGQDLPDDFLSSAFHQDRRTKVREKMPDNSVAVFFSNPVRNRSNDVDYVYHQDPDFYYLTGHREPHAVMLIFKEWQTVDGKQYDELVFVQPRDVMAELWTGRRLGTEGVKSTLQIDQVFNNHEFDNFNIDFSQFDKVLFYNFYDDVRNTAVQGDLYDLISWFKEKAGYPSQTAIDIEALAQNLDTQSLEQIMHDLRGIKTPEELILLRKAVKISAIGQVEVMKAMRPGMSEREVQGIHEFVFKKYQAEYEGYPSIVGAGHNGCILHYVDNYKPSIDSEELILMDLGAEYHGYTADVTRTIPIDGKFSKEEKAIYDLVYKSQEAAMQMCKPGVTFDEITLLSKDIINEGLAELGIIETAEDQHLYYPHGLSHHIGLDVHDKGNKDELQPNMVITIEPGIYIPEGSDCDPKWWKIAVRIEDDILITDGGFELLSDLAPRKSEEIEKLMMEKSILDQFILPDLEEE